MIRKCKSVVLIVILVVVLLPQITSAQMQFSYFTDYMYISNSETSMFNEIMWFWQGDHYGAIHCNDNLGIRGGNFFGQVSTSQSELNYRNAWFAYEPWVDVPHVYFGLLNTVLEINALRAEEQGNYFTSEEPRLEGRLTAEEDGWLMERWLDGTPYNTDYLVDQTTIPYGGDWVTIYHDGELELSGENVAGKTAIACTQNIRLIDNIIYAGYNANTFPDSFPSDFPHYLNILSGGNVVIADTDENGRGNGGGGPGGHDRRHIIITAAIQCYNESFTFEDQNDAWDTYIWCDGNGEHAGETDERGSIYFRGALAQTRRGYVHRSNCAGTGYSRDYNYDFRWLNNIEHSPGTNLQEFDTLLWRNRRVVVDEPIVLEPTQRLIVGAGTEIILNDENRIRNYFSSPISLIGEENNPVRIIVEDEEPYSAFRPYNHRWDDRDYPVLMEDEEWDYVELTLNGGEYEVPAILRNVVIRSRGEMNLTMINGDQPVTENCRFEGNFVIRSENRNARIDISHTVVEGRMTLQNSASLDHVVFSAREEDNRQTALYCNGNAIINNSFFLGSYRTVFNGSGDSLSVKYSGTYGTTTENPWGYFVERGEGVFSADPLCVDVENGDFHLRSISPLIDAGDPESLNDPDGSRTDVGAFPYDAEYLGVRDEIQEPELPEHFTVNGPYPNPFNSSAYFKVGIPGSEEISIDIFNLGGQLVKSISGKNIEAGNSEISLDFNSFATGMYLVRFSSRKESYIIKAVLIK